MVPMYAPDGTLGDVPWDKMSDALRAGGHMGVHMKAPDGTEGIVPAERLQDAVKQGGQVVPYDIRDIPKDKKGTWDTFADDVKSVFSGLFSSNEGDTTAKMSRVRAYQTQTAQENAELAARHASEKAAGYGVAYRTAADIAEASGTNVTGMEEAAKQGNEDAVIGHMLAGQALAASPLATEGVLKVAKAVPKVGPAIGTALRTETGTLKPSVRAVARGVGAAAGHVTGIPGAEVAGVLGGPALADAIIPERPGAAPMMERRAVPITKSPNYDPTAYKAGAALRTTGKLSEMAEAPQIATPEAGPPKPTGSEGRPATWTNERVIQLATQGNRDAISQAVRRGFMLPENVRYVMGDMDYPSAVHNPRSVTKFTPTGEPITQGESDFAYRSRDIGEKGVPADQRSHAHATTDLGDLQQLAPGRASITGKGQEFVRTDLSKLTEGKDYVRMQRAGQPDWIRFLRPLDEGEIEVVGSHPAPKPHRFSNSAKTRQQILDLAKEPPEEK